MSTERERLAIEAGRGQLRERKKRDYKLTTEIESFERLDGGNRD